MADTTKIEPNTECFAYCNKGGVVGCKALTEMVCTYKKCPFFKHKSEVDYREIERAIKNYTGPLKK